MQLTVDDVGYRYGRQDALVNVGFEISEGVLGLLGPNGAGKSTLLSILATERRPTSGQLMLDDYSYLAADVSPIRQRVGYLPQRFDVMRTSSLERNVAYAAWARGVPRPDCLAAARRALVLVDLADRAGMRASKLSGGQRQRLGIACAVVHEPRLVVLDEPSVGLDPEQRAAFRTYLHRLAETSIVVVSTHLVDDLASVASYIAVLHQGTLRYCGSIADFGAGHESLDQAYLAVVTRSSGGPQSTNGEG